MKIGLVVEKFDPFCGGLEQWAFQFVRQVLDRGHELHVVSRRLGEQARRLPIVTHLLEGVGSRTAFAEAAERTLKSLELDIIHDTGAGWYCHVFQPHGGSRRVTIDRKLRLSPPWLQPLKRAADICLPRRRQFNALMARQYVNDGRTLLALSKQTAEDFQRIHGIRPEHIRLIYNGADLEHFAPVHRARYRDGVRRRLGLDDDTALLLLVAHNFRLKGLPSLLRAVRRLKARRRPVHLAVVGGKHTEPFSAQARRMGIGPLVTFTGTVEDTMPFYAAADVYVHPTFHDSCSLVVLEALASGLPVITSRFNGAAELITEAVDGHVLDDPADIDELLSRLEPLLEPTRRERMGRAARRLALDHSLEHNVDQVLAVYEEVIESRAKLAQRKLFEARHPFVCRRSSTGSNRRVVAEVGPPTRVPRFSEMQEPGFAR